MTTANKKTGLELLREPFPSELISQLPKPTCKADDYKKLPKGNCKVCGGYHATSKTVHLSYVGHAALTSRLLEVDENWTWGPLSFDESGLPLFDKSGGLWIKLTVCGVTRLGYGHAKENPYADIGSRIKEVIGDALRNAAMRFGAALDLWSKADLTKIAGLGDEDEKVEEISFEKFTTGISFFKKETQTADALQAWFDSKEDSFNLLPEVTQGLLTEHLNATIDWLEANGKHAKKPAAEKVICPENKMDITKDECLLSECHKTCVHFNKKSKLEVKI